MQTLTNAGAAATAPDYMAIPTGKLSERAMLCKLTMRMWRAVVTDARLAKQAALANSSDASLHSHKRRLLSTGHLKELSAAYTEIKAYWTDNTLPWTDDGTRVARASRYLEIEAELAKRIDRWNNELVPQFVARYPYLREEIRKIAGPLFDANEYPDPNLLPARFHAEAKWRMMPDYTDWRAEGVPADVMASLAASAQADLEKTVKENQTAELYGRLREVVAKMATSLPNYTGGRTGSFHPTLVTNIQDVLALIPKVQVIEDPILASIAQLVETDLTAYDAQTLRDSTPAREDTASKAAAITQILDQFI